MAETAAPATENGEGAAPPPPPLPPWQPTFLAIYPRALKVTVVLATLSLLATLNYFRHYVSHDQRQPVPTTVVRSAEQQEEGKGAGKPVSEPKANHTAVEADRAAPALNLVDDASIKLPVAPLPGLSEDTAEGSLPRIAEDGRQPWQTYARPFNAADRRPRIGIVVVDMGLSRAVTDNVINRLPGAVTLAFDSQNEVVGAWMNRARQSGHETLLQVPMEPFDFPRSDPGAGTLLTSLPSTDNIARLYQAMRRGTGYVGITTQTGSRFTTDPTKLSPVLTALKSRGLMFVDLRVAPHSAALDMARDIKLPVAAQTMRLDRDPSPEGIQQALLQLEQAASVEGMALGVTTPLPSVIDALSLWSKELSKKGYALAPVSAMVERN